MRALAAKRYGVYSGIRLVARVMSVVSILIMLMFFVGEGASLGGNSVRELIGLLWFPVGVAAGFIVAWKWETAGGFISLISLLCFYLVYGVLLNGTTPRGFLFLILTSPAVIFLVSGIYGRIAIGDYSAAEEKSARVRSS